MLTRVFLAMWPGFFFGLVLCSFDCSAAGHVPVRRIPMEKDVKVPVVPERATQAATRPVMVPLNEIILVPKKFCHRNDAELTDVKKLRPLMDSIAAEGLQDPIEIVRDEQGRPVLVKGYRRASSLKALAKGLTPGFTHDMPVPAVEVTGATEKDLVLRSILDNINRNNYSDTERICAALTLKEVGVSPERAASALGVSVKTYNRDLIVAEHDWMLKHVTQNAVTPTNASKLLEKAVKHGQTEQLKTDLAEWIAKTEAEITKKQGKKALRPAQQLVKSKLTKPLVDRWLAQIAKREPFDGLVPVKFEVDIDAEAETVSFKASEIELKKVPLTELAKLVSDMETAKQVMTNYLKTRHAVESAQGPQHLARIETRKPSGLDFLRKEGLEDLAEQVATLANMPAPSPSPDEDEDDAEDGD